MDFFKYTQRQRIGVHPHQIIFKKANKANTYITWDDTMKPRISLCGGITLEEYQVLATRWDEMLSLAEEIIWRNYLNPKSEDIMSQVDAFPDIRYLTGNYYVASVAYDYSYRDKKHRPYDIKEGRLRHKYHNSKEWIEVWCSLDCSEITKYYQIVLTLHLTGDKDGKEDDYMGVDLISEFIGLDDPMTFEILCHHVI